MLATTQCKYAESLKRCSQSTSNFIMCFCLHFATYLTIVKQARFRRRTKCHDGTWCLFFAGNLSRTPPQSILNWVFSARYLTLGGLNAHSQANKVEGEEEGQGWGGIDGGEG